MPVLEEGQILDRYAITRWLGSGVSGESYEAEARDETLQQKVTLKIIHPWAALGDSARRQFFREMQGIGMLNHPYLAPVLDYGEINGRLYVARRYTSSGTLLGSDGRMWFRPPLTISDAIMYGYQLAQALEYIHRQGYLHGTLTFANILVLRGPNAEGEADYAPFLLADIGLANFVRRFGQPKITLLPITAAPEQLGKRVVPASDQFALAVLVFSWLAGRPPYLGSPDEVEQLKLTETIAPLRSFNPQVTDEQENVLRRALAVYPDERYPSILAFADALLATIKTTTKAEPKVIETSTGDDLKRAAEDHWQSPGLPTWTLRALNHAPTPLPASPSSLVPEPTPPAPDIPLPEPEPAPIPEPQPTPSPEPKPQIVPEPTPPAPDIPLPEPSPTPEPLPSPDVPLPRPSPEPSPSPDITQPTITPEPSPSPDITQPTITPEPLPSSTPTPLNPEFSAKPEIAPTFESLVGLLLEHADDSERVTTSDDAIQDKRPAGDASQREDRSYPTMQAPAEASQVSEVGEEVTSFSSGETSSMRSARFIIISPYIRGPVEIIRGGDEITLGRAGSCDILLDYDPMTSRHHALLKREGQHYVIYDQQSISGVTVNGQKLAYGTGQVLSDGDQIRIGNYELIFHAQEEKVVGKADQTNVVGA